MSKIKCKCNKSSSTWKYAGWSGLSQYKYICLRDMPDNELQLQKMYLWILCPAKIQISLRICAVWSDSSLGIFWISKDAKFLCVNNEDFDHCNDFLGPVVQCIISFTSSLVVKMLTVLVSTISNLQVFLLKNVSSFCKCKSYSHFFSKNISIYAIFNDQSFNNTLTNYMVSFEQLGPGCFESLLGTRQKVFVCVEVLQPSQPNGVMSSMVSLPSHTFTGQA